MEEVPNERWRELCALAAVEQDPAKLIKLVQEINCLLKETSQRLRAQINALNEKHPATEKIH
jgi:hypothetical protein